MLDDDTAGNDWTWSVRDVTADPDRIDPPAREGVEASWSKAEGTGVQALWEMALAASMGEPILDVTSPGALERIYSDGTVLRLEVMPVD